MMEEVTAFVIQTLTLADLASLMLGMERVDVSNGRFSLGWK
jgi:hypothetical protein